MPTYVNLPDLSTPDSERTEFARQMAQHVFGDSFPVLGTDDFKDKAPAEVKAVAALHFKRGKNSRLPSWRTPE